MLAYPSLRCTFYVIEFKLKCVYIGKQVVWIEDIRLLKKTETAGLDISLDTSRFIENKWILISGLTPLDLSSFRKIE